MLLNKLDNPLARCGLKFDTDERGVFEGYAAVFGGVDSYGDTIVRGAFADTLANRKQPVRMFYGHSPGRVIGKRLLLFEDEIGLRVKGRITLANSDAADVYALMQDDALDGMSIGFRIPKGGSEEKEGGGLVLTKIDLIEISVVSMPADSNARVDSVKAEIEAITNLRDAELFLRDASCFPRSMAKAFLSQLRPLYQREADEARAQTEAIKAGNDWLTKLVASHTGV